MRYIRSFGLHKVTVVHDNEPLVVAIADAVVAALGNGSNTSPTRPGRHAPLAERAIRCIKEGAQTAELHAHSVSGMRLIDSDESIELLCQYSAAGHNRFSKSTGHMLSPLQRALGASYIPHLMYPWGCLVYAEPPDSLKDKVAGKFDLAGYLGRFWHKTAWIVPFRTCAAMAPAF